MISGVFLVQTIVDQVLLLRNLWDAGADIFWSDWHKNHMGSQSGNDQMFDQSKAWFLDFLSLLSEDMSISHRDITF